MLKVVLFCLIIVMYSYGDVTQTASPSCPVRPASDISGPPGLPGRPGSKGERGNGKFIVIIARFLYSYTVQHVKSKINHIWRMQKKSDQTYSLKQISVNVVIRNDLKFKLSATRLYNCPLLYQ